MLPGTGCTALGNTLVDQFGEMYLPEKPVFNKDGKLLLEHKHNSINRLIKYRFLTKREAKSLLKFSTIRNPFDLLATEYQRF